MNQFYFCLVFALILNSSLGMVYRHKRQTSSNDNGDNSLDDRYGWDRPSRQRPRPNQSWQNQGNQWQNQGENWPTPNQNRPQPNQNWPQPNQNWPQPNQNGNLPNQGEQNWPQPNQNGNLPNQGEQNWPQPNTNWQPDQNQGSTQSPNGNGSTTSTQSPAVAACIRNCPTTPEYNPVCGSDGTTYDNAGRLSCAQQCGVNVSLQRLSRCPATTPAPTTSN